MKLAFGEKRLKDDEPIELNNGWGDDFEIEIESDGDELQVEKVESRQVHVDLRIDESYDAYLDKMLSLKQEATFEKVE